MFFSRSLVHTGYDMEIYMDMERDVLHLGSMQWRTLHSLPFVLFRDATCDGKCST